MTTTSNLHLQLEPGEIVLDGEAEMQRVIASVGADGHLRIHRERWSLSNPSYPDGCWHHDHDWGGTLRVEATRKLVELLGPTTEQLDVYRTRCQQLAERVIQLEQELGKAEAAAREASNAWIRDADRINAGTERIAELEDLYDAASRSVEALDAKAGDLESERDRLRRSLTRLIARARGAGCAEGGGAGGSGARLTQKSG